MNTIFEWEEDKNLRNQLKHCISFELAQRVFEDPFALLVQTSNDNGDGHLQAIGLIEEFVILLAAQKVSISDDKQSIKIVSARRANLNERICYENQAG